MRISPGDTDDQNIKNACIVDIKGFSLIGQVQKTFNWQQEYYMVIKGLFFEP